MGVYIHWPFCKSRCPYCDFNAHMRDNIDQEQWAVAYLRSLEFYAKKIPDKQVISIFFGGGTPSLMEAGLVASIIDKVQFLWSVANDIEITLEANPTSVENDKLIAFKDAGINRLSLGVQAFKNDDLKFLGREHNVEEALRAIELAKKYFNKSSFDLIYARPNQRLSDWEVELRRAIELSNGHLSLYQLTIERNTPFFMRYSRGEFLIPDDIKGAEFYHLTQDVMEGSGLPAYEVSNHANIGNECRHNLIYWHMADYIGIGAGAHGRFTIAGNKYSTRDHSAPEIWLELVNDNGHGSHDWRIISQKECFYEILMMGLRLRDGLSIDRIEELSRKRFYDMIDQEKLQTVISQKWAIKDGDNIRLTREGLLRLNAIIPYITF